MKTCSCLCRGRWYSNIHNKMYRRPSNVEQDSIYQAATKYFVSDAADWDVGESFREKAGKNQTLC